MLRYRGGDVAHELVKGFLTDSVGIARDAAQIVAVIKCERFDVVLGRIVVKQLLDLQDLAGHAVCLNDFFRDKLGAHYSLKSVRVGIVEHHMNGMDEITHAACLNMRPYASLLIQVDVGKLAIEHRHAAVGGEFDVLALSRWPDCGDKRPSVRLVAVCHIPVIGHVDIEPAAFNFHAVGSLPMQSVLFCFARQFRARIVRLGLKGCLGGCRRLRLSGELCLRASIDFNGSLCSSGSLRLSGGLHPSGSHDLVDFRIVEVVATCVVPVVVIGKMSPIQYCYRLRKLGQAASLLGELPTPELDLARDNIKSTQAGIFLQVTLGH